MTPELEKVLLFKEYLKKTIAEEEQKPVEEQQQTTSRAIEKTLRDFRDEISLTEYMIEANNINNEINATVKIYNDYIKRRNAAAAKRLFAKKVIVMVDGKTVKE